MEATVGYAAELGYKTTAVKMKPRITRIEMQAALELSLPDYASAIVTTEEIVAAP